MAQRAKKRQLVAPPEVTTNSSPARAPVRDDLMLVLRAAIIIALGIYIYWPALTGDWLWDDRDLIAENTLVHDPDGLWKIWTQPSVMFDFLPLKISVEWIDALWSHNVAENPDAALPHNDLGVAFARRGQIDAAIDQFRIAARLDPRYIDADHNLTIELLQAGRLDEALHTVQTGLQSNPESLQLEADLTRVLQLQKQSASQSENPPPR
jgi:tetratricopeptide (TPR) repeat protein